MKVAYTIGMLLLSSASMMGTWYGVLRSRNFKWEKGPGLMSIFLARRGLAACEFGPQGTADRCAYTVEGGPFTMMLHEIVVLAVFTTFTRTAYRSDALRWCHRPAGGILITGFSLAIKK